MSDVKARAHIKAQKTNMLNIIPIIITLTKLQQS